MPRSAVGNRLAGLFIKHPHTSYNVQALLKTLPDVSEANIRYHLRNLSQKTGVLEPLVIKDGDHYGFYLRNPKYKTPEEVRAQVFEHIQENNRVIQDGRKFNPVEPVIQSQPSAALPIKQLFMRSILERMVRSNDFTDADIMLIKQEVPHLIGDSEPV